MIKKNNLIRNLRLLMTERGLSAMTLSFDLNFSANRIEDILNPSRKIRLLDEEVDAIANYFNIDSQTLLHKEAFIDFK